MSKKYIEARRKAKKKRERTILYSAIAIVLIASAAILLLTTSPSWVISVDEAVQKVSDGAFVLDVRELNEYQAGHIPGAYLIPLDELSTRLDELPQDHEIVIYCQTGNRSEEAYNILSQAGYTNITSLKGGITAWASRGNQVTTGE